MAVTVLSGPDRRRDAAGGNNNAGDFALLLVQEWLVACKLGSTARCLVDECARSERDIPVRMVWNRMVESLGFGPRAPATGGKYSGGSTTLLEKMVTRVVEQHEKDVAQTIRNQAMMPHQQVVVMSKRRELRFVNKRSLPRSHSATPSNNTPDRPLELSSSASVVGLRPKSAMVCKSALTLSSKAAGGDPLKNSRPRSSMSSGESFSVKVDTGRNQRPISAASLLTPHKDSLVRKKSIAAIVAPLSRSPTSRCTLQGVLEEVAVVDVDAAAANAITRHSNSVVGLRASLPHITEIAEPATSPRADEESDAKGGPKQDQNDGETPAQQAPKLSLEEMSEERLMEQFGSISRCAIKKLRRVLAKSNAYSQEFEKSQRTLDKIKARAKLHQLRRVLAEEQTPLLTSTMASLTSEPCSLCLYVFPKNNLTTKVSYKSIVDLRASWIAAAPDSDVVDNSDESAQQTEEGMNHARIAHLYDEAPVCVFCSQLVLNYSSYRPSSVERRAQQARKRRETLKSLKDLEAKGRHDLEKCDPLDYQSYELNSDDDDSGVEEVVEVKTDGRPQVIRRRIRQTMRTPVQLGVVSKRLHYDQLRSDTLHTLTLDEWHKIMR